MSPTRSAFSGPILCEACHSVHAAVSQRYLQAGAEEDVCLQCHDGSVTVPGLGRARDILTELQKSYSHPVPVTPSAHAAGERPASFPLTLPEISPGQPRHSECVDCHDPHDHPDSGTGGLRSGALPSIWGISESGAFQDPVLFQYEICLKCHGDSANKPQSDLVGFDYPNRQSTAGTPFVFNQRHEFSGANPSFHPVFAARGLPAGPGGEVPSLRPFMITPGGGDILDRPLGPGTQILCTDCHNSDTGANLGVGSGDPAGPHGSSHRFLLERGYELEPAPAFPGGDGPGVFNHPGAYAICDKCHDVQGVVMQDELHEEHIEEDVACASCHAPHGVFGGTPVANSHLIDFDLRIVGPNSSGQLRFEDRGFRRGSCYLRCHGEDHDPEEYPD